VTLVTVT